MCLKYIYFSIPTSSGTWTPPKHHLLNFIFFEISAVYMNIGTGSSLGHEQSTRGYIPEDK